MADLLFKLRDTSIPADILSQSMANPDDVGWPENDARRRAIAALLNTYRLQGELNCRSLGAAANNGHDMAITRDGSTIWSATPPAAFAGRTLRRYVPPGGDLVGTEVFTAPQEAQYRTRLTMLKLSAEAGQCSFTDLAV